MAELGYSDEIYKLLTLNDGQRHNLLNKLNLMPGHRARFNSFFESIQKTFPIEERSRSIRRPNQNPIYCKTLLNNFDIVEASKSHSQNPKKKRSNIQRKYKNLDSTSKQNLNKDFLNKVLNKTYKHQKAIAVPSGPEQKNKSAVNAIFPSSMYEKYGIPQSSKFTSKQPKPRVQSSKNQVPKLKTGALQNYAQRENITPTASLDFENQDRSKVK
jgi:hypothetical protein